MPRILAAKVPPPSLPTTYVPRPLLEGSLDGALNRRLTVLMAGAGFGKSTLLAAWTARHRPAWSTLGRTRPSSPCLRHRAGHGDCGQQDPWRPAVTAHDPYSAKWPRKSNDAQVVTMGGRVIAPQPAVEVLDHRLASELEGGRSVPKVEKMEAVDERHRAARQASG